MISVVATCLVVSVLSSAAAVAVDRWLRLRSATVAELEDRISRVESAAETAARCERLLEETVRRLAATEDLVQRLREQKRGEGGRA